MDAPGRAPAGSREEDRLLFEANPNPMFVFAEDSLRLLEVNEAMVAKYGWSRAELLAMTLADLRPPEEVPRLLAALDRQRGLRAGSVGEWRHRRKDGSCFDAEVTLSCLDYQGAAARLVMVTDITERKHVEVELRHSRELLEEAEHLSHTGAWEWDLATNRWTFSEEWLAIHGCMARPPTPVELLGLAHPDDRPKIARAFQLARSGRAPFDMVHRIVRRTDGEVRIVHGCGRFVRDASGQVAKLYGFAHDITERKRAERHMEFLDRLHPLMMQERNPQELIRRTLQQAARHLGLDRASWSVVSPDQETVESDDVFPDDRPVVSSTHRVADFGDAALVETMASGQGIVVHDVASDPFTAARSEAYLQAEVGAFAAEVLVTEEGPQAVITAISIHPRVWRPDETQLLRDLAARLFPAVERARAELAMRESEAKYRSLFESIDAGFCLIEVLFDAAGNAVDHRFLEVNPAFERHTGIRDAVGRRMREIAPEHEEHWFEIYGGVVRTGVPLRFEHRAEQLGRWFHVFAYRTGPPESHRVAVLFNDITERKRAEAALRESEERFRGTFENAAVGIAHVAPDGRWLRVNDRLCETVGYSREEMITKTFAEITHPDDVQIDWAHVRRALAGEIDTYSIDKRYIRKDGSIVWISLTVSLARKADGSPDYFISVIRDISARKQAEARIRQLNEELETRVERRTAELAAANRELEAFSYSVSHDLRAPLRAMDGFSKILLEDYGPVLDATGRDYLGRVRAAAQRMGQLIDVMLQLSRLNRCEILRRPVDLSALAWSVAHELKSTAPGRDVEWVISPGLGASGDPRLLRVLLENLLGNAWKYTARTERARIEFGRDEGEWFVRDNGVGFDMENASRLFVPFQRLHTEREFEGIGIGLATVQRIVARHGGTIRAEGVPGQGAEFRFTLGPEVWPG